MLVVLICSFSSAQAAFYSGSKLVTWLERDIRGGSDYESGIGTGYVLGAIDTGLDSLICFPPGDNNITVKQVKQIVYNYMQKHPEMWNLAADASVIAAMREVFPCKK